MENNQVFEKVKGHSMDITDENIKKIGELFPEVMTESVNQDGKLVHAIDFEKLKQLLSDSLVNEHERYDFTWVGKNKAILEAGQPIEKTLRPLKDKSVDWDNTENIYIEGDNLEVLKLLQESYLNKIDVIYIDPPYNTGNDFIYNDDFKMSEEEYSEAVGEFDEYNQRMIPSKKDSTRFHSDWLNMMYSRLKLARNLLSDDGVIFISIDDNEQAHLKELCDEIFGEKNKLGIITIINNLKGRSDDKFFATCNEFLMVYSMNREKASIKGNQIEDEEVESDYNFKDEIGRYKLIPLRKTGKGWEREQRPYMYYPILLKNNTFYSITDDEYNQIYNKFDSQFDDEWIEKLKRSYEDKGYEFYLPLDSKGKHGRWRWGLDTYRKKMKSELECNSSNNICSKMRANLENGGIRLKSNKTVWYKSSYDTGAAGKYLNNIMGLNNFDNPKSLLYMKDILKMNSKDSIILDFFSGSGTTADAVMQLNAEDGGNRKFIMVQLPEKIDKKQEAYKAGYRYITEIGEERIRRAGKKVKEEHPEVDTGFRVFKVDSPNMESTYKTPDKVNQQNLLSDIRNVKEGRNDLDLLYQVMLDWGLELSLPYQVEMIGNTKIHNVFDNTLLACFSDELNSDVIRKMAKKKPLRVVFKDSSFKDSATKINVSEIFKEISPETKIKVI